MRWLHLSIAFVDSICTHHMTDPLQQLISKQSFESIWSIILFDICFACLLRVEGPWFSEEYSRHSWFHVQTSIRFDDVRIKTSIYPLFTDNFPMEIYFLCNRIIFMDNSCSDDFPIFDVIFRGFYRWVLDFTLQKGRIPTMSPSHGDKNTPQASLAVSALLRPGWNIAVENAMFLDGKTVGRI
jgi:hypothetical protein